MFKRKAKTIVENSSNTVDSPSSNESGFVGKVLGAKITWNSESEEVKGFRELMERSHEETEAQQGDEEELSIPVYTVTDPMPQGVVANFFATLNYNLPSYYNTITKTTISIAIDRSCQDLLKEVVDKVLIKARGNKITEKDVTTDDIVLKVTGSNEYIYGDFKFSDFDCIRTCFKQKQVKIDLDVLEKKTVAQSCKTLDKKINYKYQDNSTWFDHKDISVQLAGANQETVENIIPVGLSKDVRLPNDFPMKIFIKFYLVIANTSNIASIPSNASVKEVLEDVVGGLSKKSNMTIDIRDLVMRTKDTNEYIVGDSNQIADFDCVRSAVATNTRLEVELIEKKSIPLINYVPTSAPNLDEAKNVSTLDIKFPYAFRLCNLKFKGQSNPSAEYSVRVTVHNGLDVIGERRTKGVWPIHEITAWEERFKFDIFVANVPRNAKLCFTVIAKEKDKEETVGWCNVQAYDHFGQLRTGRVTRRLWPSNPERQAIASCSEYIDSDTPGVLSINFDQYPQSAVFPNGSSVKYEPVIPWDILNALIKKDPLYEMTEMEKMLIWNFREYLMHEPRAILKVVRSVDWLNQTAVCELHRLLDSWAPLPSVDALELLDVEYADLKLREYAINRLDKMSDTQLCNYLLQLVEALKYEPFHSSPLSCFLLRRAVASPHLIGHYLFWNLKAEVHNPNKQLRERFGLYIREYLETCGSHAVELEKQCFIVDKLYDVAMAIKKKNKGDKVATLHKMLGELELPEKFSLPVSPKIEASGINIPACKVMSSAKLPLYIVFKNANKSGEDIHVIFKAGDDLRQDILTLQLLKIMDNMWKSHGLNLHLIPYGCVATGPEVGMLEVVRHSTTIARIQVGEHGGGMKGSAAIMTNHYSLKKWLEQENKTAEEWDKCLDLFIHSCAGYFVSTYVMGIGDRHNDNIMITEKGNLFHIDFGHFLGHFKKVGGYERETSPFVFTPLYAHVLGGPTTPAYRKLEELCHQAYNVLRKYGPALINLFKLMLYTGIPELESTKDIDHLRQKLILDKSDEEASDIFSKLMIESLENKRQLISEAAHIMAHYK